jgi:hypothetical protein
MVAAGLRSYYWAAFSRDGLPAMPQGGDTKMTADDSGRVIMPAQ